MVTRIAIRAGSIAALFTAVAAAGDFHVDYSAPPACPDRAEFVRAIEQRVPDWHHREGATERRLALDVRRTNAGFVGRLTLGTPEDAREVEGAECETVVRALALVAAVSLDPSAARDSAPEVPPTNAPAPTPTPRPAPAPAAPLPPQPEARPRTTRSPEFYFGFGAAGGLLFGPAPSVLYGAELRAEIGDRERRFLLRAAGARLVTGSIPLEGANVHFGLSAAELDGCYRPVRAEAIDLSGCLVVSAGELSAEGERGGALVEGGSSSKFWGAAGARFGVFWTPLRPLELGAEAGASVPWVEHSYVFENPVEPVHTTAPVSADVRLGVTVVLP